MQQALTLLVRIIHFSQRRRKALIRGAGPGLLWLSTFTLRGKMQQDLLKLRLHSLRLTKRAEIPCALCRLHAWTACELSWNAKLRAQKRHAAVQQPSRIALLLNGPYTRTAAQQTINNFTQASKQG